MEGFHHVIEQTVRWRDLDALGHVNNAVYATYFENGRLEYIDTVLGEESSEYGLILAEITIAFKSPAFLRERLLIGTRVTEMRNSSFIVEGRIEEKETGRLVAVSRAAVVHYDYQENRSRPLPPTWRERIAAFEGT